MRLNNNTYYSEKVRESDQKRKEGERGNEKKGGMT